MLQSFRGRFPDPIHQNVSILIDSIGTKNGISYTNLAHSLFIIIIKNIYEHFS